MFCWRLVREQQVRVETYGSCRRLSSACLYRHPSVLLLLDTPFLLWAGRSNRKEGDILLNAVSRDNPAYHHGRLECPYLQAVNWSRDEISRFPLLWLPPARSTVRLSAATGHARRVGRHGLSLSEGNGQGTCWKRSETVAGLSSGQDCSGHRVFLTKMESHY